MAILGGGIGGLSAAHELVERGFRVTVIERRDVAGGKARSFPVVGSGAGGRPDWPAEHGFRLFPAFYRHLPDVMARIPARGRGSVVDHLVPSERTEMFRDDGRRFGFDLGELASRRARLARARDNLALVTDAAFAQFFDARRGDIVRLGAALLGYLGACEGRRLAEYEEVGWKELAVGRGATGSFPRLMGNNLWQLFVAIRGEHMSARTAATVWTQLTFDRVRSAAGAVRVLDGPTSDTWITPWVDYLRARGVAFRFDTTALSFETDGGRIASVTVASSDGAPESLRADAFVSALPVEVFRRIALPSLAELDPALARLARLEVGWMNGIQLYLDRELGWSRGHAIFLDSPWAVTAVSQVRLWGTGADRYGDGRARDIVSIDVSDFDTPGIVHRKPARACSPTELVEEVRAQIAAHLRGALRSRFLEARVLSFSVDPALSTGVATPHNDEPLFVNSIGSWRSRPDAVTAIENLFLASDYVRSTTDLASMEGANESARRAVNGILALTGATSTRCALHPLYEPSALAPLRALDERRFARGLPQLSFGGREGASAEPIAVTLGE